MAFALQLNRAQSDTKSHQIELVLQMSDLIKLNAPSGATRKPRIVKAASQLEWCSAGRIRLMVVTLRNRSIRDAGESQCFGQFNALLSRLLGSDRLETS